MRYAVLAKGLSLEDIERRCRDFGARDIRAARSLGQVFCELETEAAARLSRVPGLAVKELGKVNTGQVMPPMVAPPSAPAPVSEPVYGGAYMNLLARIGEAREAMRPPLTGEGNTIVVLDSGVRSSHQSLRGKVDYEANFSSSPTTDDVFGHGTAVAYMAAGGRHAAGEESGIAPGATIWNLKVLGDADGEGNAEDVVLAIDHAAEKRREAEALGLSRRDPRCPNMLNLSFGAPDDGDPDNPLRAACRAAIDAGLGVVAAAGNTGPQPGSILTPATEPGVFAVGAVTVDPFQVWPHSSRGPTREGHVKPDLVFFGYSMLLASNRSDAAFEVKSGTSFATPAVAGLGALGIEAWERLYGTFDMAQARLWQMLTAITRKPGGAPLAKDNDYGYGMPFGDLAMRALGAGAAMPQMMQSVMPVFGLALAMPLLAGMARAMRPR